MRLAIAVLAGLLLAPPAVAGPLPLFDSAAYCAHVGFVGMTQSTVTLDGCVEAEAAARAELVETWAALKPDQQGHCATAAGFSGDGSYALMQSCIARLSADAALDRGEVLGN